MSMSASAVKSSMPGVGTSPTATSHSMLPMNAVAQKVMPGNDAGTMKPLSTSGLNYVTLQPAGQPLSLVQDHRPSVYQTPPYNTNNSEKEPEVEKPIPNGVDVIKVEAEQEPTVTAKQSDSNRNNNLSPDNSDREQQHEASTDVDLAAVTPEYPVVCTQVQSKSDDKKTPVNNGSKETDGVPVNPPLQNKVVSHKQEEGQAKSEAMQKAKAPSLNTKAASECPATPTGNSPLKSEAKVAGSPKASKRKSRELKDLKNTPGDVDGVSKPKRNRIQTQPYQSPLPEIALLVKSLKTPTTKNPEDNKLIVFFKNEFLAVRNAEGSFYVCQAMQNVYKSSRRIRIRWLSQDKNNGEVYSPDFYDHIDFDCILTNLNLNKIDKNKFQLTKIELLRTENILKRAIDVEAGVSEKPRVTEEHPDGLDLSLYKDESQLKKRKGHAVKQKQIPRKRSKPGASISEEESASEDADKKALKHSRSRKQSVNKATVIAKSVAKGSSRAERAFNRRSKSGSTSNDNSGGGSDTAKAPSEKRGDNKRSTKQQSNNNASSVSRSKARGVAQSSQPSVTAGRPKRVAATTGIAPPAAEEASSRKKSHGRA